MKLIKPHALKHGATLGIVATSTPIHTSSEATIHRAYEKLRNRGYKIVEAPNCRTMSGHTAGSIQDRVKALHRFFKDPKIDGILAYWGGYQSHQLLEYLDFALIKKNPKPFIGYSDTTALQVAITTKTGLVTFSGPAGITFGKPETPEFTWDHMDQVLVNPLPRFSIAQSSTFSENPWYLEPDQKMKFQANPGWKVYRSGQAEGQILAGNLGTMLLLTGTDYLPSFKGKILFIEEDETEKPQTVNRLLTQCRQMGVFDQIRGLVIGRFHSKVGFSETDRFEMILDDALKGYRFPVMTGVDFGHTDPMITIPNGIRCQISTRSPKIEFLERAVRI